MYFLITKELRGRYIRQIEKLVPYDLRIKYYKGTENTRVDALSRRADYVEKIKNKGTQLLEDNGEGSYTLKNRTIITIQKVSSLQKEKIY